MHTVQLRMLINVMGQQIVEEVTASTSDKLSSILRAVLIRDGLPMSGVVWVIRLQGRPLRAEQTVEEAIPGTTPNQRIMLDVTGEPAPPAPPVSQGAPTLPPSMPAPIPPPPPRPAVPPPSTARPGSHLPPLPPPLPPAAPAGQPTPGPLRPDMPVPARPGGKAELESGYSVPGLSDARVPQPRDLEAQIPLEEESFESADEDLDSEVPEATEETDDDPEPAKRAVPPKRARKTRVDRHATTRYYSRMNPQRVYPLLVVISEKSVLEVTQAGVAQTVSKRFRVELGSEVEIEPILPGCTCYPTRATVSVGGGSATATFHVVPQVLGSIPGGRVVVSQGGHTLAEVPLRAKVVRQTLTALMGTASFVLPGLRALGTRYQSQWNALITENLGEYETLAQVAWDFLNPLYLAGILLVLTGILYLWFRPRRRDVFFDLTPVSPEEMFRLALKAANQGEEAKGLRLITNLTSSHPDYQPAWLYCADWYYERGRNKEAMGCYEKAFVLGRADAPAHLRAAALTVRLGKPLRGLTLLKEAQKLFGNSRQAGAIWSNMATCAIAAGLHDEAMLYIERATKAGALRLEQLQKDRLFEPLRRRPEFLKMLADLAGVS